MKKLLVALVSTVFAAGAFAQATAPAMPAAPAPAAPAAVP
ncbi:signal peptidase, partial [Ralstonia pseudosolanacearum]